MHNKYHNIITEVDGIKFRSKKEAMRYNTLKLMQAHGLISDLRWQVPYVIVNGRFVDGNKDIRYVADFVYNSNGSEIVEDVKGRRSGSAYDIFRLKKALMKERYRITIHEI